MARDEWDRGEDGELLVSMLTGFASAIAPNSEMAVFRIGFGSPDQTEEGAIQLVLRPEHVRELIDAPTKLEADMVEKAAPAGSA